MIITRTPLRISLAGGSTDMPAFYNRHPGAVLSFAIDKYIYVSVNEKFDGKFRVSYSKTENVDKIDEIKHDLVRECLRMNRITTGLEITSVSDLPGAGTGLGSSSAFTVGLLKALSPNDNPAALAERAFVVEAEKCGHACGKQDQYASAYGGMNYMIFKKTHVEVAQLAVETDWKNEFMAHALLLWTGNARENYSTGILEEQAKMFRDGTNKDYGVIIANHAHQFFHLLAQNASMKELGTLLGEAWEIKRLLVAGISDFVIDAKYKQAMWAGAYGGKLLGAGGGGFLFFLAPPETHAEIIRLTGLRKVNFNMDMTGSEVIYGSR